MPFQHWWRDKGLHLATELVQRVTFRDLEMVSIAAYDAGKHHGFAISGNYTANATIMPTEITFQNGRKVKLGTRSQPGEEDQYFLVISQETPPE